MQNLRKKGSQLLYGTPSPQVIVPIFKPIFYKNTAHTVKPDLDLSKKKRILVIRFDEIGDYVMFTPFLRELRNAVPHAEITLLTKPFIRPLADTSRYLDKTLSYSYQVSSNLCLRHISALQQAINFSRHNLWLQHFDLAIVPRWGVDSYYASHLAYFSGASTRVGYSEHVNDEKAYWNRGYDKFFTHICHEQQQRHEVEYNLALLNFIGIAPSTTKLEITPSDQDNAFAQKILSEAGWQNEAIIALAPGAGIARRCWPIERYIQISRWLIEQLKVRIVVVGSASEKLIFNPLVEALGKHIINFAGRCTLPQTAALLRNCRMYVGSDSGPLHIASAMDVPSVMISCHPQNGLQGHANDPARFHPWGVAYRLARPARATPPCTNACNMSESHCIRNVTVETVIAEIISLWKSI